MGLQILGSVSPFCILDKNCPGYLITDGQNKILLDCGPGITKFLDMDNILNNIIIISHLHKDHYGSLLELGYASYVYHNLEYLNERIDIHIPNTDKIYVDDYYKDNDGWCNKRQVKINIPDYNYLTKKLKY